VKTTTKHIQIFADATDAVYRYYPARDKFRRDWLNGFSRAMHDMRRSTWQQQYVTGSHWQALTLRKLHPAFTFQHNVVRRLSQDFLFVITSPVPLKLTSQIETPSNVCQAYELID
jgi:hypothetical protein